MHAIVVEIPLVVAFAISKYEKPIQKGLETMKSKLNEFGFIT